ncbi:MAG: homoserine kinase [Alphaproteobacteria bacterium]|nr:homoserine kinase [Alphaproteobacteria bacterium]
MAVYTQLTNETIAELVEQQYGLGKLSFAVGIAQGVENSNYLLDVIGTDGVEHKYILTLYEKRVKSEELPFFIHLMKHLQAKGIPCPQPIARKDGATISEVQGKQAALVSFLNGRSRTVIKNTHVSEVGAALAKLHLAAGDFNMQRENALSLAGWKSLAASLSVKLDDITQGLDAMVRDELAYLEAHWPANLPTGIIHADLFPDNVFFEDDVLSGIIDFYFGCKDMLAYDVAIVLNAWCFENQKEFSPTKSRLLLQHYQKHRPLNDAERAAFAVLVRGAALRFLLTRSYDWIHRTQDAMVTPLDPMVYVRKLRFHQQVKDVSEYGL